MLYVWTGEKYKLYSGLSKILHFIKIYFIKFWIKHIINLFWFIKNISYIFPLIKIIRYMLERVKDIRYIFFTCTNSSLILKIFPQKNKFGCSKSKKSGKINQLKIFSTFLKIYMFEK